jgi:hypothetical protein
VLAGKVTVAARNGSSLFTPKEHEFRREVKLNVVSPDDRQVLARQSRATSSRPAVRDPQVAGGALVTIAILLCTARRFLLFDCRCRCLPIDRAGLYSRH